jgi:hypothetical protein
MLSFSFLVAAIELSRVLVGNTDPPDEPPTIILLAVGLAIAWTFGAIRRWRRRH